MGVKLKKMLIIFGLSIFCVFLILTATNTTSTLKYYGRINKLNEDHMIDMELEQNRTKQNLNMKLVENRMQARKRHMRKMCTLLGLNKPGDDILKHLNLWQFFINEQYDLVWCSVYKAASASWMYNFNLLAGYSSEFLNVTNIDPLVLARNKYPQPNLQELKSAFNISMSFLIVRHPMERILAVFRDKLELTPTDMGLHIVKNIRHKLKKQIELTYPHDTAIPTFPEFVEFILESVRKKNPLDIYWKPIVQVCSPCLFNFEVIAHKETLQEDEIYIIKNAKLENVLNMKLENSTKQDISHHIFKYYSQLTKLQILQLYHVYRYDFELFNYSMEEYLEIGITEAPIGLKL